MSPPKSQVGHIFKQAQQIFSVAEASNGGSNEQRLVGKLYPLRGPPLGACPATLPAFKKGFSELRGRTTQRRMEKRLIGVTKLEEAEDAKK
ncbi:MAG: hypothetical protein SGPRY_001579 [Prymnesium sp.]